MKYLALICVAAMKTSWIAFVFCVALFSACGSDKKADDYLYLDLSKREGKYMQIYFTQDIQSASLALEEYIKYLNDADLRAKEPSNHRFIRSGRALALARLEFVRAHVEGTHVNLNQAIKDLKLTDSSTQKTNERQYASALIEMIRDDQRRVSWLRDFDRIATETIMRYEAANSQAGAKQNGT